MITATPPPAPIAAPSSLSAAPMALKSFTKKSNCVFEVIAHYVATVDLNTRTAVTVIKQATIFTKVVSTRLFNQFLDFEILNFCKFLRHIYHLTVTERVKTLPVLLTSVCKVNCAGICFQTAQASCQS